MVRRFRELERQSSIYYAELRDVADSGNAWLVHFGRAFDSYSKLWNMQRGLHRKTLVAHAGLSRWRIGEIASRIGQLYYQYYLRTSDLGHLQQAAMFYDIVVDRRYFDMRVGSTDVEWGEAERRLLRFHARCLVVHLLMGDLHATRSARQRLLQAAGGTSTDSQGDGNRGAGKVVVSASGSGVWSTTLQEADRFLDCLQAISISDSNGNKVPPPMCNRVAPSWSRPSHERAKLRLCEAVIVGCRRLQVKVTPISLDMYFMQQCCERAPPPAVDAAGVPVTVAFRKVGDTAPENPKKRMLYQPTIPRLLSCLAAAMEVRTAWFIFSC